MASQVNQHEIPEGMRVTSAADLMSYVGKRITIATSLGLRQVRTEAPDGETNFRHVALCRSTSGVLASVGLSGSVVEAVFAPRFDAAGTWLGTDTHQFGPLQPTTVTT